MKKILLIEDDRTLQNTLLQAFSAQYACTAVGSLTAAYSALEKNQYDVAIVDRHLPDGDGLELIEYLADSAFKTRVIALTGRAETRDRIHGLESGADEYLAKPFSLAELKLRLQKLMNVDKLVAEERVKAGEFILYPDKGYLEVNGKEIRLRKREAEILHCLLRYRNQVVTRDMLVADVWSGSDILPTVTTLDVYIRRLRVLLQEYSAVIATVRGFGYRFNDAMVLSK
jgi:DNA-binding response OmpR family regulator